MDHPSGLEAVEAINPASGAQTMPNDVHSHHETVMHFPGSVEEQAGGLIRVTSASEARPDAVPFDRDEAAAQLRRALGIGGRITWDEAIQEVHDRTAVSRRGWVSGWGTLHQLGHATFYGLVQTQICGGVPMVYVTEPEIEANDEREGLPEQEHFLPLATLYRWTPTSQAAVVAARAMAAPRRVVAPPPARAPLTPEQAAAKARAEGILLRMLAAGRSWMTVPEVLALDEAGLAALDSWCDAGCPDPAPQAYQDAEDVPF